MQKCRLLLLSEEGGANFVKPETFFLGSTYPERTLYEYVWLHKLMGEKQPPTVAGTVVFLLFPQYLERKRGGSWQHIIGPLLYTKRKHIAASSVVQRPSGLKTGLLVCILSGEWFAPAASRKPETNTTLKEFETTRPASSCSILSSIACSATTWKKSFPSQVQQKFTTLYQQQPPERLTRLRLLS